MAVDELRNNDMMAHLLEALESGKDIGHYGRLVFAIVARHFIAEEELVEYLQKHPSCNEEEARGLIQQVQEKDYNPPRRDTLLEYQQKQDFPILPDADNPDTGNVYRDLEFPERIYQHISEYHQQKAKV